MRHFLWIIFVALLAVSLLYHTAFRVYGPVHHVLHASIPVTRAEALTEVLRLLNDAERRYGLPVPCRNDSTLPTSLPAASKWLLAVNFYDSQHLMPHNLASFIQLLSRTPTSGVFVSVFESGSQDPTPRWLKAFARILQLMQVPHRIRAGGPSNKNYTAWGGGRIDLLAHVRNAALSPLWPTTAHEIGEWQQYFLSNTLPAGETWPADWILFLNDVYWCHQDAVRLAHGQGDVTCAMDFEHLKLQGLRVTSAPLAFLSRLEAYLDSVVLTEPPRSDASPALDLPWQPYQPLPWYKRAKRCDFYDEWVTRDVAGDRLIKVPPYSHEPYTAQLVQEGRPFPVQCCWNGMAKFPAKPFREGLRFRAHTQDECSASECTLMCHDLWRLGYRNFVVDPGVRMSYHPVVANKLFTPCVAGINTTTWAQVLQQKIDPSSYQVNPLTECCEMQHGAHWVRFELHCFWYDLLLKNFTKIAWDSRFKPFKHSAFIQ